MDIYDPTTDTITTTQLNGVDAIEAVSDAYYIGNNQVMLMTVLGEPQNLDLNTGDLTPIARPVPTETPDPGTTWEGWGAYNASTIRDNNGDIWMVGGINPGQYGGIQAPDVPWVFKFAVADQTWTQVGSLTVAREWPTLVLMGNKIGVYGGVSSVSATSAGGGAGVYDRTNDQTLNSIETIDTVTGAITLETATLDENKAMGTGIFLQTSYSLLSGGASATGTPLTSEEVQDIATSEVESTGTMVYARDYHSAVSMGNGLVLLTGGGNDNESQSSGEIFDDQAALVVTYPASTVVTGSTLQFASAYANGVTWACDKANLATVSSTGLLTANAAGIVTVTATANDNPATAAQVMVEILPNN
jgi:hypothetical protein